MTSVPTELRRQKAVSPRITALRRGGARGDELAFVGRMAPTAHTPARSAHCRVIFGALDGRDFMTADGRWRLEVFSVVQQAANLWVQLRLVGDNPRVVTLRLPREADARQALPGPYRPNGRSGRLPKLSQRRLTRNSRVQLELLDHYSFGRVYLRPSRLNCRLADRQTTKTLQNCWLNWAPATQPEEGTRIAETATREHSIHLDAHGRG